MRGFIPILVFPFNLPQLHLQQNGETSTVPLVQDTLNANSSCLSFKPVDDLFFGRRTMMFISHVSISSLFRPKYIMSNAFLIFCNALHGMDFRISAEIPSAPTAFPLRERSSALHEKLTLSFSALYFPLHIIACFFPPIQQKLSPLLLFSSHHLDTSSSNSFQLLLHFLPLSRCHNIFFTLWRMTDKLIVLTFCTSCVVLLAIYFRVCFVNSLLANFNSSSLFPLKLLPPQCVPLSVSQFRSLLLMIQIQSH